MERKPSRVRRIQWIAMSFLTIAGIVNYMDRSTLSIANHSISAELGLSASQMGLLLSAFALPYALSQLPVGVLVDRFGARVMMGLGMFVWSLAQLAGGLVNTLQQFLVVRVLLGIGESPQFPASAKVVSEWFAVRDRGAPTGIFAAATTLGPGLAPPLLTIAMLGFGWRGMFILMGAVGIAISIGWYLIYRNRSDGRLAAEDLDYLRQDAERDTLNQRLTWPEWRNLFAQRTTWGMVFGNIGVIYMVWLYLAWLPAYFEHERHLSIAKTGWVVSLPYVFGTIGVLLSGVIADRLLRGGMGALASRKWPLCVGLIGGAAFTVPAAFTPSVPLAVAYICAAMFFVQMASGSAWALVTVVASRHQVASLSSIQNFGGYFGGSLAPLVTGIVVDRTHSFVQALLISAGVAAAAAVIYLVFVTKPIGRSAATPGADKDVSVVA
ncbi:MFS transporter (plasmid) [Paraburkholderia sp. PREW-6R]|uniref:MFS transporter n=1 Tax=Paraburkholderia sp. PREW-6R TaxID=3141544 RepID=UPI0031F58336